MYKSTKIGRGRMYYIVHILHNHTQIQTSFTICKDSLFSQCCSPRLICVAIQSALLSEQFRGRCGLAQTLSTGVLQYSLGYELCAAAVLL